MQKKLLVLTNSEKFCIQIQVISKSDKRLEIFFSLHFTSKISQTVNTFSPFKREFEVGFEPEFDLLAKQQ
jgi:hypothetical protein